jgi:protein involved in polysaccharide export with SLBB domain
MESGQGRSRQTQLTGLGLVLVLAVGCASGGGRVDQALQRSAAPPPTIAIDKYYQAHCPDELVLQVTGAQPWEGKCQVGPDGRITLAPYGTVRIDGMTPPEIVSRVADHLAVRPDQVQVQVIGFRSQQVYLYGEVAGMQRAVPYQGPETVVELLQRVGGVTSGAAPGDVQVVRSHVADGKPPEVFNVDLAAIVLKNQQEGNIRVQPFDQIYIGQSKRCCLARNMPPWLRPLFEQACGLKDPILPPPSTPLLASLSRP